MDIPIDGSIEQFQAQLVEKQLKPWWHLNRVGPRGQRHFKGEYCGYEAEFHVYFHPQTRLVHRCKVCIISTDLDSIVDIYNLMKTMATEENTVCSTTIGKHHGFDACSLLINQHPAAPCDETYNDGCDENPILGKIELYIERYTDEDGTEYTLHIDFTDRHNNQTNT